MDEKIKTNGDRIRAMTDEELAKKASVRTFCIACPVTGCDANIGLNQCRDTWLAWLRAPVEESET